jgi:uncharacterized protein YggE
MLRHARVRPHQSASYPLLAALFLAAGLFSVAAASAAGEAVSTQVQVPGRTITSSGESVVYVVPDEAVVRFGIESFNSDLDKSKSENDQASARLIKSIKALGIEEKDIQADTLQVELKYRDGAHPTQGIEGYYSRRSYSVTLKDIKLLEKLTDTVLKNGANQLMGFEYRTSELRKHRDAARKMAIKACREKAEALAGELGCKVGAPRTISETSYGYYGNAYRWGGNNYMMQNSMQVAPGGGGEGGETMPLGQMGVHATVSVTFDLIPAEDARAESQKP